MSVELNTQYWITNAQSGTALDISNDGQSVVGNPVDNNSTGNRQLWTLTSTPVGVIFVSAQSGQSVGFAGDMRPGVTLIVGGPNVAKAWITELVEAVPQRKFKLILSGSDFVIGLPRGNPPVGTPVSVSADAGADNQLWVFTKASED